MRLYKYLPRAFAVALVERGEALFRTLSYFRAVEHAARGDEVEGVHVDAPNHDVTLHNLTAGGGVVGRLRMLNSINQELVYAYCLSQSLDDQLFTDFQCDTCVMIHDVDEFVMRMRTASRKAFPSDHTTVLHRSVEYFDPTAESPLDIRQPANIPFLKHRLFEGQREYRAIVARPRGLTLLSRIVQPHFTFEEEIRLARKEQRVLRLGRLTHIAELVPREAT